MTPRDHFRAVAALALDHPNASRCEQWYTREDAWLTAVIGRGAKPGDWFAITVSMKHGEPETTRARERLGLPTWREALAAMLDGDAASPPLWPERKEPT